MLEQDERCALGLLLDFEYLLAEVYNRAKSGIGLTFDQRGANAGPVTGGRKVKFVNPILEAFVTEAARDTISHILVLRRFLAELGERPYAASSIDIGASFTGMARSAALIQAEEGFDAFANETNLVLAAFMLEDVVMTDCAHALSSSAVKWSRDIVVGLFGSIASRTSVVRTILFAIGQSNATNSIAICRQKACSLFGTAYQGNDHGVGTPAAPSMMPVDGRGLAWTRTPEQSAAILAGSGHGPHIAFFPAGLAALQPDLHQALSLEPVHFTELSAGTVEDGVELIASFDSEDVLLPPLSLDANSFHLRENEAHQPWTLDDYASWAPSCIQISNAVVHGAVGIVGVGRHAIAETLWHTTVRRHRHDKVAGRAILDLGEVETLEGTTVSILVGATESYWHALIDAVARLVLVPETSWPRVDRLLFPAGGVRIAEMLSLYGLPPNLETREVQPYESFRVSTLIQPSSLHGLFDYHPTLLRTAFLRLASSVDMSIDTPRHIFIDRRGSPLRKLVNEDDLIAALPDFKPVRLETLTVAEQIRLFANADIVVAPHGAGLTNVGFCRPGTVLIELMMDSYCNWCYRRLAAIKDVVYHCVLGRCLQPDAVAAIHFTTWTVDENDLLLMVDRARDRIHARKERP